jgi:hypothetical protein
MNGQRIAHFSMERVARGDLYKLYSSPDNIRQMKSRRMRLAKHVTRMGKERKMYKILVGKPEVSRPFEDQGMAGRMGSKWISGRLVWGGGVECIHLAQNRDRWRAVVNTVMSLRVLAPWS